MSGFGSDEFGVGVFGAFSGTGVTTDEIVLDPPEVSEARMALNINTGEIRVGEDGPDWGESLIEAFMAEQGVGQVPVDFRIPNRTVRIPLLLGALGVTFEEARARLQQKVGLLQQEGGWVRRNDLYADVVNASLTMPDKWGFMRYEADVMLVLECLPDFYGDEIELTYRAEVVNPVLIFPETGILGDMPGRVTILATEFEGQAQRGLVWGFRSRHYSTADTAQLRYRAQDMTPVSPAATAALTGSVSGSVVRHDSIGVIDTPILSTDISDGSLTHTGSYRVMVRAHTNSPLALSPDTLLIKLAWDVGDYTNATVNDWVAIPGRNNFYVLDLGEVYLEPAPTGEHHWKGQIRGVCRSTYAQADISIDEVWFVPTGEGSGVLRASVADATGDFGTFTALGLVDNSEGSGNLHGKTMHTGGTWETLGPGNANSIDFVQVQGVSTTRVATSDTSDAGRLALAGTGTATQLTNHIVFGWSPADLAGNPVMSLYQRYTDETHNIHCRCFNSGDGSAGFVFVYKRNGGLPIEIGRALVPAIGDRNYALKMATDTTGAVYVWLYPSDSVAPSDPVFVGFDSDLATGGALASGRHGFRDYSSVATPITRYFAWYAAWPGQSDAVMFPNRSVEVRTDGVYRQSADGTGYGQVQDVEGDLPRIPNAGLEGRSTECFVKASRGDFHKLPDPAADNIIGVIKYRPAYLFPR